MVATALALVTVITMLARLLGPILSDPTTYGWNDWDSHAAYRYMTVLSLKQYGELPWWNPYFCGGFPSWAYVEGASNLVSPYLPFYLLLPLNIALRAELLCSAALGALFTYLFAGRYTRSVALRLSVVVLFALNGRWALQMAEGHTWFLQYAWLPLILYLFDRGVHEKRASLIALAGVVTSLLVYMGGIYPLPHTALILILYSLILLVTSRSVRPLAYVALLGIVGLGVSAPKLFPALTLMRRFPRFIDSPEAIDLKHLLVMMTAPVQTFYTYPIAVPAWEWHEWGTYVGWAGVAALSLAIFTAKTTRENVMRVLGIALILLGQGAFHPFAPWTLLHRLPIFASQHVPSRFHYPAFLMLAVTFASIASRWLRSALLQHRWLDTALVLPVFVMAVDVAEVGRQSMSTAFYLRTGKVERAPAFVHHANPRQAYTPRARHPSILLPMMANEGSQGCYGLPPLPHPGAIAVESPNFKGPAYLGRGTGEVTLVSWSPNAAVVDVRDASAGSILVYNMNWDPGWQAGGAAAAIYANSPAAAVEGTQRVVFRYRPPGLSAGLLVFALTVLVIGSSVVVKRRRRRRVEARSEGES